MANQGQCRLDLIILNNRTSVDLTTESDQNPVTLADGFKVMVIF